MDITVYKWSVISRQDVWERRSHCYCGEQRIETVPRNLLFAHQYSLRASVCYRKKHLAFSPGADLGG